MPPLEPANGRGDLGVLVMGMHRSGTSALAAALIQAGFYGGEADEFERPGAPNPAGYGELREIRKFNDRLLVSLGWSWDGPAAVPPDELRASPDLLAEGRELVARISGSGRPWMVKDPRISIMLPLWRRIALDRFVAVVMTRPPDEVAWSLSVRDGMPLETGLALWAAYYRHLCAGARGLPVLVVNYLTLIAHPRDTLTKVKNALAELGLGGDFDVERAAQTVRPALRRATFAGDQMDLVRSPSIQALLQLWQTDSVAVHQQLDMPVPPAEWWESALLAMEHRVHDAEVTSDRLREQASADIEASRSDVAATGQQLVDATTRLSEARRQLSEVSAQLVEATQELVDARVMRVAAEAETEAIRNDLAQAREQLSEATAQGDETKAQLAQALNQLSQASAELSRETGERDELVRENGRLRSQAAAERADQERAAAELEQVRQQRDELGAQQLAFIAALPRGLGRPRSRERLGLRIRSMAARLPVPLPARLSGNPLFDQTWYEARYPDAVGARFGSYRHYRRHGVAEGRDPSEFFDTDWYLDQHPDVRARRMDPLDHYLVFGWREGRDPSPRFDSDWYLYINPDVFAAGVNPLLHFLRFGRAEGRLPGPAESEPIAAPPVAGAVSADPIPTPSRGLAPHVVVGSLSPVLETANLPAGRRVVVAGAGVQQMATHEGRTVAPLSRTSDGRYARPDPECGIAAIAQIEAAHVAGFDTFLLPAGVAWWLDQFPDLRSYLDRRYERLDRLDGANVAWALDRPSRWRPLDDALELLGLQLDREPIVLDWNSGANLAGLFPTYNVFSPHGNGSKLPYLDKTADLVVVAGNNRRALSEAARVARTGVVQVRPSAAGRERIKVPSSPADGSQTPKSVVIVVGRPGSPVSSGYMRWLVESLPAPGSANIAVCGPHDLDRQPSDSAYRPTIVIKPDDPSADDSSPLEFALKSTEAEVVAVVSADTWPLPGWWQALTRRAQRSGCVVGGMVLDEAGRRVLPGSDRASELGLCSPVNRSVRLVERIPSRFALGRTDQLLAALHMDETFEAQGFIEPSALAIAPAGLPAATGAGQ